MYWQAKWMFPIDLLQAPRAHKQLPMTLCLTQRQWDQSCSDWNDSDERRDLDLDFRFSLFIFLLRRDAQKINPTDHPITVLSSLHQECKTYCSIPYYRRFSFNLWERSGGIPQAASTVRKRYLWLSLTRSWSHPAAVTSITLTAVSLSWGNSIPCLSR